jgi:hypothetical protein
VLEERADRWRVEICELFNYCALRHPEHAALIARVLAIPTKRSERRIVTFLTPKEVKALLAPPTSICTPTWRSNNARWTAPHPPTAAPGATERLTRCSPSSTASEPGDYADHHPAIATHLETFQSEVGMPARWALDTKKKELVGNFKAVGRERTRKGQPVKVNTHDFPSYETIISLIAATTTSTGLKVYSRLDEGTYETGIKITNKQMAALNLHRHDFHGDWNYTIKPSQHED